jgi:hypothetical protein
MKARLIEKSRTNLSDEAFVEIALWLVPLPVSGSAHNFKYRLALVVNDECVLRYDNERGKGDHRHINGREEQFQFTTLEALVRAFNQDVERMLK